MTIDIPFENAQKLVEDHVRFAHQNVAAGAAPATLKAEKLVRPSLKIRDGRIEEEAWEFFNHQWTTYKTQGNLTVATKSHLESCLGDEVTHVLFGRLGQTGWDGLTEETLLTSVKDVFVKKRNRMINRLKLQGLMQGPDQPVQQYVASLKQIARTCQYSIKCSKEGCNTVVDYSSEMVLDQLIRGLNDDDIQKKVLSSREDDFNLTNIEKIIITEECSKTTQQESKSTLPSDQISALSTYKRNKRAMATPATPTQKPTEQKCSNCGSDTHKSYRELPEEKKNECKAHNKFCENCGRRHHLTALCRSLPPEQDIDRPEYYNGEHNCLQILPPEELQDEVSSLQLMSISATNGPHPRHTRYNPSQKLKQFTHFRQNKIKEKSYRNQIQKNTMVIDITLDKVGYKDLQGVNRFFLNATSNLNITNIPAVADTGAEVCCAPSSIVAKMGLKMSDTFRTKVCLYAADKRKLHIKGCLPVIISTRKPDGMRSSTRELIYFVDNIKDVFLSHEALVDLGSITSTFPQITAMADGNQPDAKKSLTYADIASLNLKTKFFDEDISSTFHTPPQSPIMSRTTSRSNVFELNSIQAAFPQGEQRRYIKTVKGQTSSTFQHSLASATSASIITKVPMNAHRGEIIDINAGVKDDAEDLNGAAVAGNYFHNLQGGIWRPWA